MTMATFKQYLGDGVYADFDGWSIVLTTENGVKATNTIYLEESVVKAFYDYIDWLKQHPRNHKTPNPTAIAKDERATE